EGAPRPDPAVFWTHAPPSARRWVGRPCVRPENCCIRLKEDSRHKPVPRVGGGGSCGIPQDESHCEDGCRWRSNHLRVNACNSPGMSKHNCKWPRSCNLINWLWSGAAVCSFSEAD